MAEQPFSAMLLPNKCPPPHKLKNSERRSREYLLPAEVRQLIEAAKKLGRHGHRDAVLIMMAYRQSSPSYRVSAPSPPKKIALHYRLPILWAFVLFNNPVPSHWLNFFKDFWG